VKVCCLFRLQGVFDSRNIVRRIRSQATVKFPQHCFQIGSDNIALFEGTLHGLQLPVMAIAGAGICESSYWSSALGIHTPMSSDVLGLRCSTREQKMSCWIV
jgi:hypothetical protein